MTADKRTVSTDALETLGMIHTREEKRDAIHLAVLPVECAQGFLLAGQHVRLVDGKARLAEPYADDAIGIVDPFLNRPVSDGQRFWLVIYPRVITSLRHVWTHPAIADEVGVHAEKPANVSASEEWLRNWCAGSEISYDELIEVSANGVVPMNDKEMEEHYGRYSWTFDSYGSDRYLFSHGSDAHSSIPAEVWDHVRNVIGKEPFMRADHFTCSC